MDDGIQFGEVQYDQPDRSLRPDRDGHFAVAVCGDPPTKDLPIFVDLDAMRDMEAHAQTCLLYTSPSPRDATLSRMPSSA